jgi:2-(3-amino-3-carboxypropyl)histidine synthase
MIEAVVKEIEGYSRIAIQAPEGLKRLAEALAIELEKRGKEVFIFSDPCYGACDIKDREAKELGAEALIHLGHRDFGLEQHIPVIFHPYYYDISIKDEDIKKISDALGNSRFSICFSINFEHVAKKIASALEELGKQPLSMHCVLGCSFTDIEGEGIVLYVGDGNFHPLGIALKNHVFAYDPLGGQFQLKDMNIEGEAIRKRIRGNLMGVLNAERIGVIVSTKRGQQRMEEAIRIKRALEGKGKKAEIFVMDRVEKNSLLGYGADGYINTACPRIAIDDEFEKPMVNYMDIAGLYELEDE